MTMPKSPSPCGPLVPRVDLPNARPRRTHWLALLTCVVAACGRTGEASPPDGAGGVAGRDSSAGGSAQTHAGNSGDDGASGGAAGAPAAPSRCDDLRDHPLGEPLTIVVRNERSELLYLSLYSSSLLSCDEQPLARVQRAGADVTVGDPDCSFPRCDAALGDGSTVAAPACSEVGCLPRGELLAPGAELSKAYAGEWLEQQLRAECYAEPPPLVVSAEGARCASHQPLADGDYTLTARAFTEVGPATTAETFFALPDHTRVGGVPESELIAQVTVSSPHGVVELVFHDTADAGVDAAAGGDASIDPVTRAR